MKHYVVAGGAGFLGSHLVDRILAQGDKVTVLDNFITGKLENLPKHDRLSVIDHDVRLPIAISNHVDFVCNLACPASPKDYYSNPLLTMETNSAGTKNLLELAKHHKARFFHTSTSEVYGDPLVHPQDEGYFGNVNPYCQRSCYDEGKRYAEALIYLYRHQYDVNCGIIRIFNTYGPRMGAYDGRVISTFVRQALAGEPLTVQDKGLQTRSFCYVDDQIEGMMRMIHANLEGPINIGNPGEFTILKLAQMVIRATRSKSHIVHIAPAPSDPKQRRPDIALAKAELSWKPTIALEEGLKKTITWFRG